MYFPCPSPENNSSLEGVQDMTYSLTLCTHTRTYHLPSVYWGSNVCQAWCLFPDVHNGSKDLAQGHPGDRPSGLGSGVLKAEPFP